MILIKRFGERYSVEILSGLRNLLPEYHFLGVLEFSLVQDGMLILNHSVVR